MEPLTRYFEDFLNNIPEDMVLYINKDTFLIEPLSCNKEYNLRDAEEWISMNDHNIYVILED